MLYPGGIQLLIEIGQARSIELSLGINDNIEKMC